MEKDQTVFRNEVAAICGEMGIAVDSHTVLDLAQRVGDRVREAATDRARRAKATDNLENARKRERSLAETLAIHEEKKRRMTSFFGVSSLAEVAVKLRDVGERNALQANVPGKHPPRSTDTDCWM